MTGVTSASPEKDRDGGPDEPILTSEALRVLLNVSGIKCTDEELEKAAADLEAEFGKSFT